jgi:hypothetical protein
LFAEMSESRRVEPHRGDTDNAAGALGMRRREPGDIGGDLAGEMRAPDPQVIEQRSQPVGERLFILRQGRPPVVFPVTGGVDTAGVRAGSSSQP